MAESSLEFNRKHIKNFESIFGEDLETILQIERDEPPQKKDKKDVLYR